MMTRTMQTLCLGLILLGDPLSMLSSLTTNTLQVEASTAVRHLRSTIEGGRQLVSSGKKSLKITFTNTANQQPLSPSLFVVHSADFQLFTVGKPSSEGMATLAETGNPKPLADAIKSNPGVLAMALSDAPVFPGNTSSVIINLPDQLPAGGVQFSYAGMLINTNDAYAGVCGFRIPLQAIQGNQRLTAKGESFDAGSEENNELCSSIPGPACAPDSGNVRSLNGEGVVSTPHRGVLGVNAGKQLTAKDLGADGLPLDKRFTFTDPVSDVTLEFGSF